MPWPDSCLDKSVDPAGVATLSCIPAVLHNVLLWLFGLAGIAAAFLIIYSGIRFLTSGGDPKQVEGARKTMTYAIIGLVIILTSFFIIQAIGIITGATCISVFGFDNCK